MISAIYEANRQVRLLAAQYVKDPSSFRQDVESRAHTVLWTENRRSISEKDINNQW